MYAPGADDVGAILKFECTAYDAGACGGALGGRLASVLLGAAAGEAAAVPRAACPRWLALSGTPRRLLLRSMLLPAPSPPRSLALPRGGQDLQHHHCARAAGCVAAGQPRMRQPALGGRRELNAGSAGSAWQCKQ